MVLPWVKKHETLMFQTSKPINYIKRETLRELKKYSLYSVIDICVKAVSNDKNRFRWLPYLILKWKFLATDNSLSIESGRKFNQELLDKWCNDVWHCSSDLENIHHFMRTMIDTQQIWQKQFLHDVFFFPGYISLLDEDNSIRQHVLASYDMDAHDFGIFVAMLFMFRESSELIFATTKLYKPAMHVQLLKVIDHLSKDWREITAQELDSKLPFKEGFVKYLAEINLKKPSFENTESPWIEQYPIIKIDDRLLFTIDSNLWRKRISTYFYERLGNEFNGDEGDIGLSFELYCKKLVTPYFKDYKFIDKLPKKSRNADFLTEDADCFYIFEIKHKKYDPYVFSASDAKRMALKFENQFISGYQQVKATAENIDKKRGIFLSNKKKIDKKKIGFVVTEKNYLFGDGVHFSNLMGSEHQLLNDHISDLDIYFIGMQELELLLMASAEYKIPLYKVVKDCFQYKNMSIEIKDIQKKYPLKKRTIALDVMDRSLEILQNSFSEITARRNKLN